MIKLNLCTTCGGEAMVLRIRDYPIWQVKCFGSCKKETGWHETKEEAVKDWNKEE